jgi:hypothetical protein
MDGQLFDKHLTLADLEKGIDEVLLSPLDVGVLEMIVARPGVGKRKVLAEGVLDESKGLIGDSWSTRGSGWRGSRPPDPENQINVMNYRFALLIAGTRDRVPLAGDQLYVDLDLGRANVPPGTRIAVGSAVIEVTPPPHLGCKKFVERFGVEAMKFANSDFGREHGLRGVNARIITGGPINVGDIVTKVQ